MLQCLKFKGICPLMQWDWGFHGPWKYLQEIWWREEHGVEHEKQDLERRQGSYQNLVILFQRKNKYNCMKSDKEEGM